MRKWLVSLCVLVAIFVTLQFDYGQPAPEIEAAATPADTHQVIAKPSPPKMLYGINIDDKLVIEDVVKPNENLSTILSGYDVSALNIDRLARKAQGVFDVRKINVYRNYKLICSLDSVAQFMIYEPDKIQYVIFDLNDSTRVYTGQKEVLTVEKIITGSIETSLYDAMLAGGASPQLVDNMADIYGWQLDFTRLQKGDRYKVIYQQKMVEGEVAELGPVLGAEFVHENNPFYAIRYDQGNGPDYFDESGNSLRKAFLKYPVKFTRISSRYSGRRFHPVLKRYKSHLGTDYAAPRGTPIRAVGDGVVQEARYRGGNGNYVKIRHNATYSTQYLHMSKIAGGIKPGTKVVQGQTIGYVGSTGLANGPHLCYRFWKNGVQVDAMKVELPPSEPILPDHQAPYDSVMMDMVSRLHQLKNPKSQTPVLAAD